MNTPNVSRSFWVERPGEGRIRTEPLGQRGANEVLVKCLFSGVSRGTEALVFSGDVPLSVAHSMRCPHQDGEFPWPLKYGYCNVGRVVEGPETLAEKEVFCLHPHQDYFIVSQEDVVPLPSGLSPERAVLAANMETALNALWDANLQMGERVNVVGAGVVGLLSAYLAAQSPGTEVTVVDVDQKKLKLVEALGLRGACPNDAPGAADLVIHASGAPEGLRTALHLAAFEARIIELSWYGTKSVPLPLGEGFHPKRLKIISSQVGTLPASQRARWTHRRRLEKALELCTLPGLDALISGESSFDALPQTMPRLVQEGALCHRIRYD